MAQWILECPLCGLRDLQIEGGRVSCGSCEYEAESKKHMDLLSIQSFSRQCPGCGVEALVDLQKTGVLIHPGARFFCFACGNSWSPEKMEYCPECGEPRPRDEFEELIICRSSVGFYVCRNCYNKIFSPGRN